MMDLALFEFCWASLSSAIAGIELGLVADVAELAGCCPSEIEPEHTKTNIGRDNLIQFLGKNACTQDFNFSRGFSVVVLAAPFIVSMQEPWLGQAEGPFLTKPWTVKLGSAQMGADACY
jgi:hypothetical protein